MPTSAPIEECEPRTAQPLEAAATAAEARRRRACALWLAALALVLGLLAYEVPLDTGGDPAEYWMLAQSLHSGQGYRVISEPGAPVETKRPPGYPAFLGAWMGLFGNKLWVLKLSSLLCFAVAAALTYAWVTRQPAATALLALAAALLFLCNVQSLERATRLASEMLFTVLGLAVVLLADSMARRDRARLWAVAGLGALIVGSIYVRPNGVALVPAIALFLLTRRRWQAAGLVVAIVLVGVAPWAWLERQAIAQGESTYFETALPVATGQGPHSPPPAIAYADRALHNIPIRALSAGQLVLARPLTLSLRAPKPGHGAQGAAEESVESLHGSTTLEGVSPPKLTRRSSRYALALLILAGCVLTWRGAGSAAHWYTLFTALMLLAVTYGTGRYWFPLLPFFGWFVLAAVYRIGCRLGEVIWAGKGARLGMAGVWATCVLSSVLALIGVAQSVDAKLQTRGLPWWAPERYEFVGTDVANYVRASLWIRDHTPPNAVVVCRKPFNVYETSGRKAKCLLWTRKSEALWQQTTALEQYGPVYIIQDAFGTRYADEDLSQKNLVPAIARHTSEVIKVCEFGSPTTIVWQLRQLGSDE